MKHRQGASSARPLLPTEMIAIVEKLRKMDRREFLDRSRQELQKRSDAALSRLGFNFAARIESLPTQTAGRFLFAPEHVESLLQLIRERVPGQAEKIIARAEKICAHRFDLLGYEDLDFGQSINWHRDVVHGKTAPRKAFHRIRYLDFDEVGDSKVTWELNRHQHLVTLAKAYRLTSDEKFAQEVLSQWRSWHADNRYPIGINWASSLEVGFRSLSWMWMHALLEGTKVLPAEFRREYLRAQSANGRHIERYLSTYFSPNTHLLGEGVALFFLGTMCGELKSAERWKSTGLQIVLDAADRQVNSDGMHFEQSTYYHVYALDCFLHTACLASTNGLSLPRKFEQTIERMTDALYLLGRAGPPPRFGDDDGGRVFDAARNRDEHLLDPLALGAIRFERGDFKRLARDLREETIWLAGDTGVAKWDRIAVASPAVKSTGLTDSGIYLLSASESGSQSIVKSVPATERSTGHAHADALSLNLQDDGRMLLIDPGTCVYVGQRGERNRYRATAAHNTLTVDGQDQAEPAGPFSWKRRIPAAVERWIVGETLTLFQGSYHGYARLPQPACHRRWVIALKSGIFLVRDLVQGAGEHRLDLSWTLDSELEQQQEHLFRFNDSLRGIAVLPAQDHVWAEEVCQGLWSPSYGAERQTTVLKFARTCRLPAEFATLLVPLPEATAIPGKFFSFPCDEKTEMVRAYRYETEECDHRFFFAGSGGPWHCGAIKTDAEFVCITTPRQSHPANIFLSNGSYFELEGKRLLSADHVIGRWELLGKNSQVFSSDAKAETRPEISNSEGIVTRENRE